MTTLKEAMRIERRLARHAGIMRQLEASGLCRKEASRRAFDIVKLESPLRLPDAPWDEPDLRRQRSLR
jgi:hypothetical protein